LRHKARSFTVPPGRDQAEPLLAEIATAPCPFAAATADAPLALYGAGNLGRLARDYLKAIGRDVVMAIDLNAVQLKTDAGWSGVPLLHPDAVADTAKTDARLAVCVVTSPYVPLERSLSARGFKDIVPFFDLAESFRHLHPLSNGWFAPPLTARDQANTATVLTRWDDDISRAHHLQFLAWRRLREEWTFEKAPVPDSWRYFIPEVTDVLHGAEVFIDAGAHHGSVIDAFIKQTKGAFRQIVAIEPDASNRARLEENLRHWLADHRRVAVLDCALAQDQHEAPFHEGLDYASQLSGTGRTQVMMRPLDALGLSPTFMKLHLEGGELAALKGARQTLLAHRPIVVATVYHNADGIWETPHWLMDTLPDYRFLFRAHAWCGNGAVIYAMPHERLGRA
jgi:FkbM family methyltransferase